MVKKKLFSAFKLGVCLLFFSSCSDPVPLSVSIKNLTDSATVNSSRSVVAEVLGGGNGTKVLFYDNDALLSEDSSYPYKFEWILDYSDNGNHTIKAVATDGEGSSAEDSVTVTVDYSAFAAIEISYWAGSGANEAVVIVDFNGAPDSPGTRAFGYRWDGSATGEDMLFAVHNLFTRDTNYQLFIKAEGWGEGGYQPAVYGFGWDNDLDNTVLTNFVDADTYTVDAGDCYEGGWLSRGYWSYCLSADGENWEYSSTGVAGRTLSNGSWDAFCWAPGFNAPAKPENIPAK